MLFTLPEISSATVSQMLSPSLVVCRDRVIGNIEKMIEIAGTPTRLRPHCKTHKMASVIRLLVDRGVTKHKAATVAEAEMVLDAGGTDVLLAYNPVGPNVARVIQLRQRFPDATLSVTADHEVALRNLSAAAADASVTIGVMLDINVGQLRTGIAPDDPRAIELYTLMNQLPGIEARGFHVYDGHQRQLQMDDRRAAVAEQWLRVTSLRERCIAAGCPVPTLVCGGTPTFPVYAEMTDPAIELSPGTSVFHDAGYGTSFPDLPFKPAALLLTRVVSRPSADRVTLDLGNKAVAADPPKGARVVFPDLPEAIQDTHNEEHLVLVTQFADRYQPGDALLAIPSHICPTSALYDAVYVVEGGQLVDTWEVTGRNRRLTI